MQPISASILDDWCSAAADAPRACPRSRTQAQGRRQAPARGPAPAVPPHAPRRSGPLRRPRCEGRRHPADAELRRDDGRVHVPGLFRGTRPRAPVRMRPPQTATSPVCPEPWSSRRSTTLSPPTACTWLSSWATLGWTSPSSRSREPRTRTSTIPGRMPRRARSQRSPNGSTTGGRRMLHIDLPELVWTFIAPRPVDDRSLAPFTAAHDVFGDGTVTLVHTPGHTPGSMGSSPGRQECRHSCPSAISPTTDTCWKPRSCQALLSTGHHGSERRSRKAAALSSAPTPPELCGTTGSLPRVPSTPGWHRFVPFGPSPRIGRRLETQKSPGEKSLLTGTFTPRSG